MASTFLSNFRHYITRSNLSIALLGFASGLPIMMTLSTLTYWLSTFGVDKKTIGLASLLGTPYVLKFLWAPLLDLFQPPLLKQLGRRKSWIVLFLALLAAIFYALAFVNPGESPLTVGILIFTLATASASLDIVVDAYRIDYLSAEEQSYGSSSYLMMYRIAMLIMGAGVLALSDIFSWGLIFKLLSLLFLFILFLTLFIYEPKEGTFKEEGAERDGEVMDGKVMGPKSVRESLAGFSDGFRKFFRRENALLILIFIICYKLPDAISGVMVTNFYYQMGYTGTEIGAVTKVYGLVATMFGAFLAGAIIHQIGLYRSLFFSAILIGLTNFGYLLILSHQSVSMLMIAISAENFIAGFSSALFIMFLSLLCDKDSSATQYALLSALAAFGVRVLGGGSGFLAEYLDWFYFFVSTAFLFVPALLILMFIKKDVVALGKKEK